MPGTPTILTEGKYLEFNIHTDNVRLYAPDGCLFGAMDIQGPSLIEICEGQVIGIPQGGKRTMFIERSNVRCYAGGDPYVYPLHGEPTKLPNTEVVYRLYQDEQTVINARVAKASANIQQEIESLVNASGITPVSTNAFFFSHLFIASGDDEVTIELESRKVVSSKEPSIRTLQVGNPFLTSVPCPYDSSTVSHVSIPIRWGNDMCLMVRFSRNPQVRNGLSLSGSGISDGTGLLVRNYRPKFFSLNDNLTDKRVIRVPKNCTRQLRQSSMIAHNEVRMTMIVHT